MALTSNWNLNKMVFRQKKRVMWIITSQGTFVWHRVGAGRNTQPSSEFPMTAQASDQAGVLLPVSQSGCSKEELEREEYEFFKSSGKAKYWQSKTGSIPLHNIACSMTAMFTTYTKSKHFVCNEDKTKLFIFFFNFQQENSSRNQFSIDLAWSDWFSASPTNSLTPTAPNGTVPRKRQTQF